jgi:hypothetical protein
VRVTKVTWSTSRGASGTAQGTTGWSFPVTLPVGNTTVTVRAQDAAGHSRTDSLLVTVQALPLPGPITVQILQVSHPGDVIRIDRCLVPCGAMTAVASIPWSERQWIDQAIQPAQDYCYRAAVVAGPTVYPFSPVVCSP